MLILTVAALVTATPANVEASLAKARGGDTIALAPGAYPRITVYGLRPASTVTIDASAATIGSMAFTNASNFVVEGGSFGPARFQIVQVINSDHLALRHGYYSGAGAAGIAVTASAHIDIVGNRFRNSAGDGVDIAASQFITVDGNSCAAFASANGVHPDCVEAWSVVGKLQTSDLDIENNVAVGHMQGFTGFDHGVGGYSRVTVKNNVAAIDFSWAGQWNACQGCVMTGNIAYTLPTLPRGFVPPTWQLTALPIDRPDGGNTKGNVSSNNINGVKP
jgi:hypothetical protein